MIEIIVFPSSHKIFYFTFRIFVNLGEIFGVLWGCWKVVGIVKNTCIPKSSKILRNGVGPSFENFQYMFGIFQDGIDSETNCVQSVRKLRKCLEFNLWENDQPLTEIFAYYFKIPVCKQLIKSTRLNNKKNNVFYN